MGMRLLCRFLRLGSPLALAFAVVQIGWAEAPEKSKITILHTSDLHGHVLPFDDVRSRPARGSLAQVATFARQVRDLSQNPVLVLDSGDTIQGTPFEQFIHVRWEEPSPTLDAMNWIGYDAMAIGNHEFNFGLEVLTRAVAQAEFPVLAANVISVESGESAFQPYVVLDRAGVRIGVLGLVTPNIPGWEMPEHYRGLQFLAMDTAAERWVLELRGPQHCDLVVVLVHTGLERDTREEEARSSSYENYAWRLAQIPGVDVLLTGHTHDEVAPRLIGDTIVSQPSARSRVVTKIDLELERGAAGWRVRSWSGENVDVSVFAASEEFVEHFEERHTRVVAALDGPVGVVEREVSIADCRVRDCAALDLVRAVQLEASGAELSLASLLSNRTPVLPTGPVTWRWVHSLYVYPNTLVKLKLNGRQVREVLEHAARYYDDLICDNDSGCRVVANPRVRDYNIDSMAGVTYRIDPTAVQGSKIWDLRFDGKPVADDRVFTVVCNNYRAAGGGLFPHIVEAEIIWQNSAEMTNLIGDYLANHNPWVPSADGNWVVAPRVREQKFISLGR